MDGNCLLYTMVTGRNTSVVVVGAMICLFRGAGCGLRPCCVSNVSRYPKDVKSRSYFFQEDFRREREVNIEANAGVEASSQGLLLLTATQKVSALGMPGQALRLYLLNHCCPPESRRLPG